MRVAGNRKLKSQRLEAGPRAASLAELNRAKATLSASDLVLAVWLDEDQPFGVGVTLVSGQEKLKCLASGQADPEAVDIGVWPCNSLDDARALRAVFHETIWLQ